MGFAEVRELYLRKLQQGKTAKQAAQETQAETGLSAVTGRPLKEPKMSLPGSSKLKEQYAGQYPFYPEKPNGGARNKRV
jgi:hypothetical protein